MGLQTYKRKRNFKDTPEPKGKVVKSSRQRFVVQEHHASQLHFDFRLEMGGVLKSWAVPKGPSMSTRDKRLAVEVEDHPVDYLDFEGHIAEGNYGAGEVRVWDIGTYEMSEGDEPMQAWEDGKLKFTLDGDKLQGEFNLVRLGRPKQWLLMKAKDKHAQTNWKLETILSDAGRPQKKGAARARSAARKTTKKAASKKTPKKTKRDDDGHRAASERRSAAETLTYGRGRKRVQLSPVERAPMPTVIEPMLATLVDEPFDDDDWLFETKWDGVRAVCYVQDGDVRFISRNEKEMGFRYPELKDIARALDAQTAILDGEIVAFDADGRSSFQLLQSRVGLQSEDDIAQAVKQTPVSYCVFDLVYYNGCDLQAAPLEQRKALLTAILRKHRALRYSDHRVGEGQRAFRAAQRARGEGIIAKERQSRYEQRRSSQWLKIKTQLRQEVVIGGYTAPRKSREHFGALVVGVYRNGDLQYVGHVGGGFNRQSLAQMFERLQSLKQKATPFAEPPRTNEDVQWVKPQLVAEVKFAEWTADQRMRQPIFLGLRDDKDPRAVRLERHHDAQQEVADAERETKMQSKDDKDTTQTITLAAFQKQKEPSGDLHLKVGKQSVALTSLDKPYWPSEGYSKGDLLQYYARIGKTMLPHLKGRPLILIRYPNGVKQKFFFQHELSNAPDFVRTESLEAEVGRVIEYGVVDDLASLLYVVNLGTIAQNPWLSRVETIEHPDWVVFDLDPEKVKFGVVCEVALALKEVLDELGVQGYAKTSGASGMHVYVPIRPQYSYEQAAEFAERVAAVVAARNPDCATLERSLKKRKAGRVYVDHLQNAKGKTVAAAYSVRAKPDATVSAPLTWTEVKRKPEPSDFTIANMPKRIAKKGDLFKPVLTKKQSLAQALKKLDRLRD